VVEHLLSIHEALSLIPTTTHMQNLHSYFGQLCANYNYDNNNSGVLFFKKFSLESETTTRCKKETEVYDFLLQTYRNGLIRHFNHKNKFISIDV
jgi:hypothetical protein